MTMDQINLQLSHLIASSDPAFAQAANQVAQIAQQIHAGQMSQDEVAELLHDIQLQFDVIQDAEELQYKELLNTCINGLILLASALG